MGSFSITLDMSSVLANFPISISFVLFENNFEKNDFFSFIDTLPVSVVVFPEANFEITLSVEVDFSDNLVIKPRFLLMVSFKS